MNVVCKKLMSELYLKYLLQAENCSFVTKEVHAILKQLNKIYLIRTCRYWLMWNKSNDFNANSKVKSCTEICFTLYEF